MDRGAFTLPALFLAVLAGLGVSETLTRPPKPDGKIHVTYWEKWSDFEFDAMKHVVDEFNKSQDKIQVEILSISGIDDKTLMSISAGIPPDVAGLYGANVSQYADDRAVIQLDDLCREAGIRREQYIPVYWDIGVVRGKLFALPSTPATTALHYNRAMMRTAGIDPDKPPETMEELSAMSDKITKRGPDGHLLAAGFVPAEPGWWNWSWGSFWGGKLWDGKDKITVNSPENVAAYEWVQSFSKKYGPGQLQSFRSGFGNFSSPQNGFMAEHDAMEIQGVWMYNFIQKFAPKLDWAAAAFPHPASKPELANTTVVDLDVLCIPVGAKHPKEAFEFIKYVQSQKGMEMLCLGQRKTTPLIKVSDGFVAHHPNPFIKLFIKLANTDHPAAVPHLGIWPEFNNEINSTFDEIVLMKKPAKQALDDLQARMQPKLDQYLHRLHERGEG